MDHHHSLVPLPPNLDSHGRLRQVTQESRNHSKNKAMALRRFGLDSLESEDTYSLEEILGQCKTSKFSDKTWLLRLQKLLASGEVNPDEFFKGPEGTFNLHSLSNAISGNAHTDTGVQLLALKVSANLGPLSEKNGLQMARALGPYLVTLLSSSENGVVEGAAISIGNLGIAGFRVTKVLMNQGAMVKLAQLIPTCGNEARGLPSVLYAIYHLLHSNIAEENFAIDELDLVSIETIRLLLTQSSGTAHVELYWVLYLLSCDPNQHEKLANERVIHTCLDTCTYEIFQKSDPRPLVKVVTPLVRLLANLCGGPAASEKVCLLVIQHPDLTAILMALLGTNYTHLCRETLWWFSNIINSDSVVVQEQFVELSIMDRLEFHTIQAVQKLDPYAPIVTH